jgi:hypothetical protein
MKLYYIDDPIPNTPATNTIALATNNNMIIVDTSDLPIPKRSRRRPYSSKNKLYIKQEDLDLFIQL